jgi:3-isopropylmalate/(R)-2-methylmalate dehydratase large subunit
MIKTIKEPKSILQKIWDKHIVTQKAGHPAVFGIDLQLIHEVTSPQAFQLLRDKGWPVKFPQKHIATLDHSIPTRQDRHIIKDPTAKKQVDLLRKNAKDFGIKIFDFGSGNQGIVHIIGPELGLTKPGMTIVCGDSHTSTHGAFGALAFGIGSTEVGLVMATGCILQSKPKTMKVEFAGKLSKGVYSKDMILKLISQIGVGGANGYIIEYQGEAIRSLSMEARMTICNMSIECGARAGLISPDQVTFDYLQGRKFSPQGQNWDKAVQAWKQLSSDPGCVYDKEVFIDCNHLEPMITWGTNPAQAVGIDQSIPDTQDQKSLDYTKLKSGQKISGLPIQWAFLGSCTNARIEDLRIAANILQSKKVSKEVVFYVVPGSESVKQQAEAEGLHEIFIQAGAKWRNPGCSMCLGMNDDKVPTGQRCLSTSNRNFVGRQGTGSITHLASPATVAVSAIEGKILDPRK